MKVDIPEPMVCMATGILVDRLVKIITGKDIIANIFYFLNEKQRLKRIEARRVVDVMGDTVGFLNYKGEIIKGDLNVN